jgi:hypothetical protein
VRVVLSEICVCEVMGSRAGILDLNTACVILKVQVSYNFDDDGVGLPTRLKMVYRICGR